MMNPVFILLVILFMTLMWFLLSFVFFPLGQLLFYCWAKAKDEMNKNQKEKEKKQ
ncbi:hypothetical protein [Velocimicrobium porci]|uniref:hypothetical protein n=1 Tax=Velocimicrobium porci TaxID=2606634 RepID=UPI0012B264A9|nr:hypothetical protein [Velocimicrobium porci]